MCSTGPCPHATRHSHSAPQQIFLLLQVSDSFRKTAANFHYEFNMRHLTNVFEGLLKANPKNFVHGEQLVHLWLHESERVYGDRLVSRTSV